jgi:hypothetical protein
MRYELTILSNDRGLSEITLNVPRGHRGEGLELLHRALPAIRDLERRMTSDQAPEVRSGPISVAEASDLAEPA